TRRRSVVGIICWTRDAGCSSKTTNTQAEIMKSPSSAPSIRYSGQWVLSASSRGVVRGRGLMDIDCVSDADMLSDDDSNIRCSSVEHSILLCRAKDGYVSYDAVAAL